MQRAEVLTVEEIPTLRVGHALSKDDSLMRALSDRFSRMIMLSTIEIAKSVEDLSRDNDIPLSTCYRRIAELSEQGILILERIVITPSGKKYALYRAAIKGARVEFGPGYLQVSALLNEEIIDRLRSIRLSMRFGSPQNEFGKSGTFVTPH